MLDEKLTSRVFRLYSHKLHKQRLNDIKSKISTRINNSVPRTLKYQQIKRSGYASQTRERKTHINRENEKIFQIISKISDGKRASSIYSMCESIKATPKPKSLNMTSRKKEAQRIVEDNYALAKRLSESTRGVSFKRFDDEWQNTTKYMNSISKRNIRKLPKLEELNKFMHSVPSSDIGSKKVISLKSPAPETYKNSFSPNFNSSLPGSVLEVANEDKDTPKASQGLLKKELAHGNQGKGVNEKDFNEIKFQNKIEEKDKSFGKSGMKDEEEKNGRSLNGRNQDSRLKPEKSSEKVEGFHEISENERNYQLEEKKEKKSENKLQQIEKSQEMNLKKHDEDEKQKEGEGKDIKINEGNEEDKGEHEKKVAKIEKTEGKHDKKEEKGEDIHEESKENIKEINLDNEENSLEPVIEVQKPPEAVISDDPPENSELPEAELSVVPS